MGGSAPLCTCGCHSGSNSGNGGMCADGWDGWHALIGYTVAGIVLIGLYSYRRKLLRNKQQAFTPNYNAQPAAGMVQGAPAIGVPVMVQQYQQQPVMAQQFQQQQQQQPQQQPVMAQYAQPQARVVAQQAPVMAQPAPSAPPIMVVKQDV